MPRGWWRWLSALLATLCGLAFGWVAGSGLVHAAPIADEAGYVAGLNTAAFRTEGRQCLPPSASRAQARWLANQSSSRFQPSSASSLR